MIIFVERLFEDFVIIFPEHLYFKTFVILDLLLFFTSSSFSLSSFHTDDDF
jgi:hypothetical protein